MPVSQPLRVIVVGVGAFGRNHLRVYRELQQAGHAIQLVGVVDRDAATLAEASAKFDVSGFETPGFESIEACLAGVGQVDAASVCVPTVHHAVAAAPLLAAGVDLLIEKPLAANLADAERILELSRKHGRIVQAGHLERFNPAVTAARSHLHQPMFFEAHRLSVFTPRSLDVDVVLDLMIHDLDIVLSLVASPVREVRAVGLPVLSRKVDIANVRLEFENGCVANFTASRVSTERVRKLRFFQPHQYLSLDFARQDLLMIDVTAAAGMDPVQLAAMAQLVQQAGQHPSAGLSLTKVPVEQGEPLRLEIESFLQAVRNRTVPVVSGEDGRAALALALEINEAIAAHTQRTGL
ncbi:MAG: oxidoreductase domain protein [Edaphobacter sp.]|nr:oxidoreductase domain protein [Edaphobacter sp.]